MSSSFKYKALILDVDGTLVDGHDAVPSKRVIGAIKKARNKIHVGLATSRPLSFLGPILENIELSGPSILSGGCEIIDLTKRKVLWQKTILVDDIYKVNAVAKKLGIRLLVLDGEEDEPITRGYKPKRPLHLWAHAISSSLTDKFIEGLSDITTVAKNRVISWDKINEDVIITHAEATKQHGILEIAKILSISTNEIIGVGDGYNDFPLLMACGLKVAMGNAVKDLREIADYVCPSIDKDGVAKVIEKFVL